VVYDLLGNIVQIENKINSININDLCAGAYTFRITTDKEITFSKIILSK
jgi:hypothetical protein